MTAFIEALWPCLTSRFIYDLQLKFNADKSLDLEKPPVGAWFWHCHLPCPFGSWYRSSTRIGAAPFDGDGHSICGNGIDFGFADSFCPYTAVKSETWHLASLGRLGFDLGGV